MEIPPEQFKLLLAADHYILLCQARTRHPAVVDMNTLATSMQPEIKSILDSIHPFLAAHESYFPKDSNLIVIHFLVMATALANNLSPAFQSSHWDSWKIENSTRMFKLLGVVPEHIFCQGLCWEHFQGAASNAWFANFMDHYLFLHLMHTQYPQVLDFDILVNWCQPDMVNLINHVHPFLVAHVEHFLDDRDPLALQFLITATVVANNLGPCFFNLDWTLWLVQDPHHLVIGFQNFKSLFTGNLHFPGSQHLVIYLDLSPSSKATLYTSDLSFFQNLDKLPNVIVDALQLLSRAGVYPIYLPA
ncbi:hypothetical protein ARMGADRAFT_1034501 [Armillaria gallica]|uniref:Uncharacterized protein n=1 Tax=Armillaria gallica TaxID=47427 RepID=A0A2H3DFM9_ARMGA|nr:hypothetical protein ARMGADRAFT_1034501 [Armillaria gallica]